VTRNNKLSLRDEILLLLSDKALVFGPIRETLNYFGYKNKKVIWSTLERLASNGYLKKSKKDAGIEFLLIASGRNEIPKEPTHVPRPNKSWDRKWRMVLVDIPEQKRRLRDKFSAKLKEMGFARMQNSVYISVHDVLDGVQKLGQKIGIKENIKTMLVENIDIPDQKQFVQNLWNLTELNQMYKEFIDNNKNGYKNNQLNSDILKYGLRRTKYQYLNILHLDPILPKELLPSNWIGYEAEKTWRQMEKILETY